MAAEAKAAPIELHQVIVGVRGANGNDPGEATIDHYALEGGSLTMTDENGAPLGNPLPLELGDDPKVIARRETVMRWNEKRFNRRLDYPPLTVA